MSMKSIQPFLSCSTVGSKACEPTLESPDIANVKQTSRGFGGTDFLLPSTGGGELGQDNSYFFPFINLKVSVEIPSEAV